MIDRLLAMVSLSGVHIASNPVVESSGLDGYRQQFEPEFQVPPLVADEYTSRVFLSGPADWSCTVKRIHFSDGSFRYPTEQEVVMERGAVLNSMQKQGWPAHELSADGFGLYSTIDRFGNRGRLVAPTFQGKRIGGVEVDLGKRVVPVYLF